MLAVNSVGARCVVRAIGFLLSIIIAVVGADWVAKFMYRYVCISHFDMCVGGHQGHCSWVGSTIALVCTN